MVRLDAAALAELFRQAEASPRLRSHLLLHGGHDDPVQRLVSRSAAAPMCVRICIRSSGRC